MERNKIRDSRDYYRARYGINKKERKEKRGKGKEGRIRENCEKSEKKK